MSERTDQEVTQTDDSTRRSSRRLAAFVSSLFLGPGAGHMARGRVRRGVIWFIIVHLSIFLVPLLRIGGVAVAFALHLANAMDSVVARSAWRGGPPKTIAEMRMLVSRTTRRGFTLWTASPIGKR